MRVPATAAISFLAACHLMLPFGEGRDTSTDRPSADRPSADRPSTDRPSTDRPARDLASAAEHGADAYLLTCGSGPCVCPPNSSCVVKCSAGSCPDTVTCGSGACDVTCSGGSCVHGVRCANAASCTVTCSGGSCGDGVQCADAASCTVTCSGGSCNHGVVCGKGQCNVSCTLDSCAPGGIDCRESCPCLAPDPSADLPVKCPPNCTTCTRAGECDENCR